MRIAGMAAPRPGSTGAAPRAAAPFGLPSVADAGRAAPPAVAAPGTLAGLLALQAVAEPPAERRRRALERGRSALDRLDELRLALLAGAVPQTLLLRLRRDPGQALRLDEDPDLQRLLDAIDLRCAVEAAKLEAAAARG